MCSSDGDNFDWESRHFHIEHFNERGVRKIPIRCKDYNAIPARWQFDPLRRTGNVNLARMVHNPTSSLFFSCLKTFPWQRASPKNVIEKLYFICKLPSKYGGIILNYEKRPNCKTTLMTCNKKCA